MLINFKSIIKYTIYYLVKYSSYDVTHPFTSLRALIVEMMVLLIESDETVAALLSAEMWRLLVSWAIKYPHNNIYHALFYRLIFAVLRWTQYTILLLTVNLNML